MAFNLFLKVQEKNLKGKGKDLKANTNSIAFKDQDKDVSTVRQDFQWQRQNFAKCQNSSAKTWFLKAKTSFYRARLRLSVEWVLKAKAKLKLSTAKARL